MAWVANQPGATDLSRMVPFLRRPKRVRPTPEALLFLWGMLGLIGFIVLLLIVENVLGFSVHQLATGMNAWMFAQLGWALGSDEREFLWILQIATGGFLVGLGFGYHRMRRRDDAMRREGGVPPPP